MNAQWFDSYSIAGLFVVTVLIMITFIEIGFRLGAGVGGKAAKLQAAQVRAIMGAALGLAAFMLAFSFSISQSHFEGRVQSMVEEARLARNAFLQSEFLHEPYRGEARQILRQYVQDRIQIVALAREQKAEAIIALVEKSEQMQAKLWRLAVANQLKGLETGLTTPEREPFMGSVTGLIDIHAARLQAAVMNRISSVIWAALYLTLVMSMLIMGFQAGLTGRRSPVATYTLAVAFSVVMMLITDLDRPLMSLFKVDNQVMVRLLEQMESTSGAFSIPPRQRPVN